jgi:hypothetical protein
MPSWAEAFNGLAFVVVGLLSLALATLPQGRYPKAPEFLRKMNLGATAVTSDRGWAWRYRLSFVGVGLSFLAVGFCRCTLR